MQGAETIPVTYSPYWFDHKQQSIKSVIQSFLLHIYSIIITSFHLFKGKYEFFLYFHLKEVKLLLPL
jgi:hypothetical protein